MKNKIKTITACIALSVIMLWGNFSFGQNCDHSCTMSAGPDKSNCIGADNTLAGSASAPQGCSGGLNATYSWAPTTGLSNSTIANPTTNWSGVHSYTLTVTFGANCCCDQSYPGKTCGGSPPCNSVPHSDVMVSSIFCNGCCRFANPNQQPEKNEGNTKVFPNPSAGVFTLNLGEVKPNTNIFVYDVEGNSVLWQSNITDSHNTLDLSGKAKGIYFINVTSSDEIMFFKKIVIQ